MSEENTNTTKNEAVEEEPVEGFTKDGKPRFIRTPEGNIFQWAKSLSQKKGYIECNADGVPFSEGGGMSKEQVQETQDLMDAVQELTIRLEAAEDDQKAAVAEAVKAQSEKAEKEKQILGEEYKKSQAKVKELEATVKELKKPAAK